MVALILSSGHCNGFNFRFQCNALVASETLSGMYKFELVRYMYNDVCMYVCHSACHAYVYCGRS